MAYSEVDEYILDAIRKWVWSGLYSVDDMNLMIDDIPEEGADEAMLRRSINSTFAEKLAAEAIGLK